VALDAHMARTVYLARNALAAAADRETRLRDDIRKGLRTGRGISDLIEQMAEGVLQKDLPKANLVPTVRIVMRAIPPLDVFMPELTNPRREEEAIRLDLRARGASGIPVVWRVPGSSEWVLQLHTQLGATSDAARGLCSVIARMSAYRVENRQRLEFLDESDLQQWLFEPIARELITSALGIVFGDHLRWEWGIANGPAAAFAPRALARDLITAEVKSIAHRPDSTARRAELELLYTMLLGSPQLMSLAAIANLSGYERAGRTPVVELDSVVVEERFGRLAVHLGEAKTGSGSVDAARTQLRELLGRVPPVGAAIVGDARLLTRALRRSQVQPRSRATVTIRI
jgi:hypothetical protein